MFEGHEREPERRRRWARIVESYAVVHGLSRQELRLLLDAIAGTSDKSIAAAWGRSRSTVSTYWKRIFAKTGKRPQREVFAHVLRFAGDVMPLDEVVVTSATSVLVTAEVETERAS